MAPAHGNFAAEAAPAAEGVSAEVAAKIAKETEEAKIDSSNRYKTDLKYLYLYINMYYLHIYLISVLLCFIVICLCMCSRLRLFSFCSFFFEALQQMEPPKKPEPPQGDLEKRCLEERAEPFDLRKDWQERIAFLEKKARNLEEI